jgi:hypothetical protein
VDQWLAVAEEKHQPGKAPEFWVDFRAIDLDFGCFCCCLPSFLPSTSSTSTLTSTSSPAGCCVAMELLTPEGLRVDGRRARELRAITCKYVSCRCIIDRKPSTNRQQFCLSCCVCISWLHRCVHRVRHMKNGHLQQTRWVGLLSTGQHKGCCFSLWTSITSTCFFDGFVT